MKSTKAKKNAPGTVYEKIGAKIKKMRMQAGYKSAEVFAVKHQLPRVQYWRMERGTNFTLKSLLGILDIHKVPLKKFFEDFK